MILCEIFQRMTPYEAISTLTSILAILLSISIPATQALYRRSRRVKLDVMPFDAKPLNVVFNESGSYVEFKFSISCKNQSCIIRSIDVSATHLGSRTSMDRKWTMFKPITVDWAAAGNQWIRINKAIYVHPLRLNQDSLEPLFLEFGTDVDLTKDKAVAYRKEYLSRIGSTIKKAPVSLDELKKNNDFVKGFQQTRKYFSERMCWREGSYQLKLRLHYDVDGIFTKTFRFELNRHDIQLLEQNLTPLAVIDRDFPCMVTGAGMVNVATPVLRESPSSTDHWRNEIRSRIVAFFPRHS